MKREGDGRTDGQTLDRQTETERKAETERVVYQAKGTEGEAFERRTVFKKDLKELTKIECWNFAFSSLAVLWIQEFSCP